MDDEVKNVKDIQNTLWAIWKGFLEDHSVRRYNEKAQELVRKYKGNEDMLLFCQSLIITWTPVIHRQAEKFRNGEGSGV